MSTRWNTTFFLGLLVLCSACNADTSFSNSGSERTLLQSVELSGHAYNLATVTPYDTVRLHVTALMADGTPAPGDRKIVYTTSDLKNVVVDSTGLVHARGATDLPAIVYVTVSVAGQTIRDSARVHVVEGQPTLVSTYAFPEMTQQFGTTVVPFNDTLQYKWPLGSEPENNAVIALDAQGNQLSHIVSTSWSSNPEIVSSLTQWNIPTSLVSLIDVNVGEAWIYVSTYAYGTTFTDSALITVREPLLYTIQAGKTRTTADGTVQRYFDPGTLVVPAGSDVVWRNFAPLQCGNDYCENTPVDVIFDDSLHVLASRVPVAYGNDLSYFFANFPAFFYNEHGGDGNILPFKARNINPQGTATCSYVLPVTCLTGNEARRFDRPGRYSYHSSQGATGVLVVQ